MKKLLLVLSLIATPVFAQATPSIIYGKDISASWDALSPIPDGFGGYELCYGTVTGTYPTCINAGMLTGWTLTVGDYGVTRFFVAKSYMGDGTRSLPSNEISIKNLQPGVIPPAPKNLKLFAKVVAWVKDFFHWG